MKVPYDVELPQVNILGSTMACREAGNPEAPVALFSAWESDLVVLMAEYHSAGCTNGALYRTGSHRLGPVGKTKHRVSVCRSCSVPRCAPR
jgi:hypothetical protein